MKPSPVAAEAGRPISWTRACPRHVRILRIATPTCAWLDFPKSTTGPNRWNELKIEQAACGGWESPAALRHIQPGRWMAIPGGCAACTAGDPDGTRTDGPQAADLHCAAHSTSPTTRLRSPAVRRCEASAICKYSCLAMTHSWRVLRLRASWVDASARVTRDRKPMRLDRAAQWLAAVERNQRKAKRAS